MTVYTETVIYARETYQIAIVEREDGVRMTGRIEGERVEIGDNVAELEMRDGVRYFQRR